LHATPNSSSPVTSYQDAVNFLEQGLNYEKTRGWKYNKKWLDLERMDALLAALGEPHRGYKVIHVAGTKGKGTTAGFAAHCLHRAGYRAGLLTSPHLVSARERTVVNGGMIPEEAFIRITRKMQPYVEQKRQEEAEGLCRAPTYFEMLTAMSFCHFSERHVDWASVEVGLGGRLDSTNVVAPTCCVITMIGLDHTKKLGTTPEAIAGEKAGILKDGVPVVLGRQRYPAARAVLRRIADERGCPRWEVGRELEVLNAQPLSAPTDAPDRPIGWRFGLRTPTYEWAELTTPLLGVHQLDNIAAAVGALQLSASRGELEIDPAHVVAAAADFQVAGRIEVLKRCPAFILDVAHTIESVQALLKALDTHFPGRPLHIVFGCSSDKDAAGMLTLLRGRCVAFTATEARLSRAMSADRVAETAEECGLAEACGGVRVIRDPWAAVRDMFDSAEPGDVVCATGSFFTGGEIRAGWLDQDDMAAG